MFLLTGCPAAEGDNWPSTSPSARRWLQTERRNWELLQRTEQQPPLRARTRRPHTQIYLERSAANWWWPPSKLVAAGAKETADFVHELAQAKSREAPPTLRKATSLAWERRWVRVLSVSSAAAFAHSLTAPSGQTCARPAEVTPELHDLLASGADGGRWDVQSASQRRTCTVLGSASPRSSWAGCTRRVT